MCLSVLWSADEVVHIAPKDYWRMGQGADDFFTIAVHSDYEGNPLKARSA